jgi:acetolactate synthase-1/2/3 large subunit
MTTRGADLLVDALKAADVRQLFSLSGNQILSIYDATVGRDITLIHTRHEAAAVHRADGWARMTEEPGVALVTAGPGHLNAVSALYTAQMSESPVVLLSGHAPRAQAGRDAFQEIDQVGAARPLEAAWVVESAERMGEDLTRAMALASAWPPGPVHLSLPSDLLEARVDAAARSAPVPSTEPRRTDDVLIRQALDLLSQAKRPLIIAGAAMGRARRWGDVERFGEITGIPALLMESPRGVNDPSLRGATRCLGEADVVLLLGKRLDFTLRFAARVRRALPVHRRGRGAAAVERAAGPGAGRQSGRRRSSARDGGRRVLMAAQYVDEGSRRRAGHDAGGLGRAETLVAHAAPSVARLRRDSAAARRRRHLRERRW